MSRRTKIIATLGPASSTPPIVERLILAGVNVFRINCSHGTQDDRIQLIHLIQEASHRLSLPIAVMIDLQGPKIRIGDLEKKYINLQEGHRIILDTKPEAGNHHRLGVGLPSLPATARPGAQILIDDGKIELKLLEGDSNQFIAEVVHGGKLFPRKGINFLDVEINLPHLTPKDEKDLLVGLQEQIDAVAVSFVQRSQDISAVKEKIRVLCPACENLPIIAKIERPQALTNLSDILTVSDGVMVARGDLAIEISPQKVPIAQKQIIERANLCGKYVITATQMLESMINSPVPTRAEASDIANAIFDGTDAVLLTGETAIGKYPEQTVRMMDSIICEAECHIATWSRWAGSTITESRDEDAFFITQAAKDLAYDRNVSAICVFTKSGYTAALMAKTRPPVPIIAFTPSAEIYRRLSLYWGVEAYFTENAKSIEEILNIINRLMLESKRLQPLEQVVVVCGFPIAEYRPANLTLLHTIDTS